jgi:phytol kinase
VTPPNPWLGIALVLGALGVLLGVLRLVQSLTKPHPEITRKLLHVSMGLVTLSFPWLFDTFWPIVVLAVLSITLLLSIRFVRPLKVALGGVVGGVHRFSLGEVYFPLAIAILFFLYLREDAGQPERPLFYCIPLLLLTLADAAAALVGVRYGQHRYSTDDGHKSAEGSVAFFAIAFMVVHVPLLLFTEIEKTQRAKTLLISLLLAWLVTLFEAIAWAGLDNLVLPLVAYLLLKLYLQTSVEQLVVRLVGSGVLLLVLLVYSRRTTLLGSAVPAVFLGGYVFWALGGWLWLVPPLVVFLTYSLLSRRVPVEKRRVHTVPSVLCVASGGLLWLFLFRLLNRDDLLYLCTVSFAAHLAIIGVASLKYDYPTLGAAAVLGIAVGLGWVILFVPYLVAELVKAWGASAPDLAGVAARALVLALAALPATGAAALLFYLSQPELCDCPTDTARWIRQGLYAAAASVLGLIPLALV